MRLPTCLLRQADRRSLGLRSVGTVMAAEDMVVLVGTRRPQVRQVVGWVSRVLSRGVSRVREGLGSLSRRLGTRRLVVDMRRLVGSRRLGILIRGIGSGVECSLIRKKNSLVVFIVRSLCLVISVVSLLL